MNWTHHVVRILGVLVGSQGLHWRPTYWEVLVFLFRLMPLLWNIFCLVRWPSLKKVAFGLRGYQLLLSPLGCPLATLWITLYFDPAWRGPWCFFRLLLLNRLIKFEVKDIQFRRARLLCRNFALVLFFVLLKPIPFPISLLLRVGRLGFYELVDNWLLMYDLWLSQSIDCFILLVLIRSIRSRDRPHETIIFLLALTLVSMLLIYIVRLIVN